MLRTVQVQGVRCRPKRPSRSRARPSSSIWRCRAAARMARSPGACSIACWKSPGLRSTASPGTSAGAMNAAVLVHGHQRGGVAGAREALEAFWRRVSDAARFSPFQRGPLDVILGRWTLDSSPIYVAMDLMSRLVSPYDFNPMGKNPLARDSRRTDRFRRSWRSRRSTSSSPRPMCAPAEAKCSRTPR